MTTNSNYNAFQINPNKAIFADIVTEKIYYEANGNTFIKSIIYIYYAF